MHPTRGREMQAAPALTPNEAKTLFYFIHAYACLAASATTRCLRYEQTLRYHPLVYVPLGPARLPVSQHPNLGRAIHHFVEKRQPVTEPSNYTKLSKKITRQSRRFSKLKPV